MCRETELSFMIIYSRVEMFVVIFKSKLKSINECLISELASLHLRLIHPYSDRSQNLFHYKAANSVKRAVVFEVSEV